MSVTRIGATILTLLLAVEIAVYAGAALRIWRDGALAVALSSSICAARQDDRPGG